MIEIYLAVLLFGLGTYFNKKDVFTKNQQGKLEKKNNINLDSLNSLPIPTQETSETIKQLEQKYGANLDQKCKSIQNRDFSSLLDEKSKALYKERKFEETGDKAQVENEFSENILKYIPEKKQAVYSNLTGTEIPVAEFTNSKIIGKEGSVGSNNINNTWAVPYFGSKSMQNMSVEGFQNRLEQNTGTSQFNFHKKEAKNFFVPNSNTRYVNGSPVRTDELQNRFVKSNYKTSELPFEKVRVGPGVGENYGSKGVGGFHQYEMNELAKPKTVDELRVLSNPKMTYSEPIIPGKGIDKRESTPTVERYRPTKTFAQNEDNLLRTTGAYTKNKMDEYFIMKETNRKESKPLFGSASPVSDKKTYTSPKIQDSHKNIYENSGVSNAYSSNAWNAMNKNSDYGKSSFNLPPNERDVTQKRTHTSNLITLVKSVIAPLQDKMRNTRKDYIKGNPNPEGYLSANLPEKPAVHDPNDVARTTVKETTIEYDHNGMISGPEKMTVYDPNDVARTTVKETTIEYDHDGMISGPEKMTVYDPNDVARTTIKETTTHNKMNTVVTGAKKVSVYDPNDVAKTTIKETTELNKSSGFLKQQGADKPTNYDIQAPKTTLRETTENNIHINKNLSFVRGDGKGYLSNEYYAPATLKQLTSDNEYEGNVYSSLYSSGGYISNEFYAPATLKQYTSDFEYIGGGNANDKKPESYKSAYNATTNSTREKVLKGRSPTQTSVKLYNGLDNMNVMAKKQNANITYDKNLRISRVAQVNRDASEETLTSFKTPLSNKNQNERFNPSQLNMLRKNPFAISLNRSFGASRGAGGGVFSGSESSGSGSESE